MLAFGHVMMPLSILVAVALLFLGIKLFFNSTSEPDAIEITPGTIMAEDVVQEDVYTSSAPVQQTVTQTAPPSSSANSGSEQVQLASPISQSGSASTQSANQQKQQHAAAQKPTQKPAQKPASSPASPSQQTAKTQPRPSQPARAGSGAFGVQIGAFTKKEGAEAVVKDAAKHGYTAAISTAVSSGKTFYRVRVAAGSTRSDAEKLSAELEKKGFPVQIVVDK